MDIEIFSVTVHRGLFIAGAISGVIALLIIIFVRPNRMGVFQFGHGKKTFVSDNVIGGALIGVIVSGLTLTGSFEPIYTLYGFIVVVFILVILFVINGAYWRAFKKAMLGPFRKIGAIIEGGSMKE